jgi:hemolysin activation/secretion protein
MLVDFMRSLPRSCICLFCLLTATAVWGQSDVASSNEVQVTDESSADLPSAQPQISNLFIREYRVKGQTKLPNATVEEAVYPFLGPGRTSDDVDQARAALEKAYHDAGYQTVQVGIPPQSPYSGVILLEVTENKVGRLLVKGATWFLPNKIKRRAKSMQVGTVPNFNEVQEDIIKLNKSADLRVTPELLPGIEPGTVDINLNVEDTFPLHGSLELNNRYSPNTTPLRLNGSMSYSNLWQLAHTVGFSFQLAPEELKDALIYSAFYSLPVTERTTLMLTGTKQDSDVSTLGGAAVLGRGYILGARANMSLPGYGSSFYHSLSMGMDYKNFEEDVKVGETVVSSPIEYYPFQIAYSAGWVGKKSFTELNASANFHFRGMGSDELEFDFKRFNARGSYFYVRGDLSHTHDLPYGFQVLAKAQGQLASQPLINTEQFAGGGQSSVRGYLESTVLGDKGVVGTLELRSPSFIGKKDEKTNKWRHEWRVYGFLEGGTLSILDPLPEQVSLFDIASYGFGSKIKLWEHWNGSVDIALPLITQSPVNEGDWFTSFRVWTEF